MPTTATPEFYIEQAWPAADPGRGGFYVLRGGSNWASVEGHATEWLAVADAIRARQHVSFRRCALAVNGRFFDFWSPRNATSDRDTVTMDAGQADELAGQIVRCLRSAGERCVPVTIEEFDPII